MLTPTAIGLARSQPQPKFLDTQLKESTVGVWNLKEGLLDYSFEKHLPGERGLDYSRDGAFLITGGTGGAVCMWMASTGELYRKMAGHNGSVTSVSVSPDGNHFASIATDGTIKIWEIESGDCVKTMTPPGPYAGMDITGMTSLTPAQVVALVGLGAISS